MLKSMLSSWNKNEEKYRFVNVNGNLKKVLLSVLPKNISISHSDETSSSERPNFSIGILLKFYFLFASMTFIF